VRDKEPFTQVKRVQLQNLVDEYRWQLEDQKLPATVTKPGDAPTAPTAENATAPAASPAAPALSSTPSAAAKTDGT
jgi:hypothetical protein